MAARIADRLRNGTLTHPGASRGEVPGDLPDDALQDLRVEMASRCGVVRDANGLTSVLDTLDALQSVHGQARALVAARLIASAALDREESRGGHFRSDYPQTRPDAKRTFTFDPHLSDLELEPAS